MEKGIKVSPIKETGTVGFMISLSVEDAREILRVANAEAKMLEELSEETGKKEEPYPSQVLLFNLAMALPELPQSTLFEPSDEVLGKIDLSARTQVQEDMHDDPSIEEHLER